ncbi:FAD-dependent oxidoreductase [Bifidobacterium sp. GSD1FS]|uniref:FAD-dependent oxidoreductase n=1 Tax=Bifidobacterium canis TaxID=2610880 RepID=A0A7K1J631_9BIFI|nr:FAD-dependent oxidoreductase [Bifidobacterium canis]
MHWIGFLPGKRESRRFIGDYTLTANDILENTSFGDAIAYGGWPMDLHAVGGIAASSDDPTTYYKFKDVYQIPYRCLYSRNIDNLFLGGRLISTTHIAFGSTRVMGTCSVIGQAIGLATWLAERYSLTPRKVGKRKIQELQQEALKEDLYIPRVINEDPLDLARSATVSASSSTSSRTAASAVINGTARTVADKLNYWESATDGEEWIDLDLSRAASIRELNIRFDSNLSREIMPSLLTSRMALQEKRVQSTLVKDFTVQFFDKEKIVKEVSVRDNYMRNYWLRLEEPVLSDKVHIMLHSTNGDKHHRILRSDAMNK